MAYSGFILLGIWDSGVITLVVGSIPQVLPPNLHSLGFAVYSTALSLGCGIFPVIAGIIIDSG
jgi:hypothetical protein